MFPNYHTFTYRRGGRNKLLDLGLNVHRESLYKLVTQYILFAHSNDIARSELQEVLTTNRKTSQNQEVSTKESVYHYKTTSYYIKE